MRWKLGVDQHCRNLHTFRRECKCRLNCIIGAVTTPVAQPRRVRRSQADRRRETRAKLLDAAFRCIAERGHANTTLVDIANAAKLTKGAIQHHFADKRELDLAVFYTSFEQLVERLAQIKPGPTLSETIAAAVDGMYEGWSSPAVRAGVEVSRVYRDDPAFKELPPFYSMDTLYDTWRQIFADAPVSDERIQECYRLVHLAVRGHISIYVFGDTEPPDFALLKTALHHLLTVEEKASAPQRGRRRARR